MTDLYRAEVLRCEEDCLTVRLDLVYPDAGAPGGREFARLVLWSLVRDIKDNPFNSVFEAEPDVPPSHFIRAIHMLSAERDEASAQELAECTRDGQPHPGDTTWIMAIRVRDADWLGGLEVGRYESTGAYNSEEYTFRTGPSDFDRWYDRTDTSSPDMVAIHVEGLVELYKDHAHLPGPLLTLWEDYAHGRPAPLSEYDNLYERYQVPHLLRHVDLYEFQKYYHPGFLPLLTTAGDPRYLYAYPTRLDQPLHEIAVIELDLDEYSQFRQGDIYQNLAHGVDEMFARAQVQSEGDAVAHACIVRDRARTRAWFAQRGLSFSLGPQGAFAAFFRTLLEQGIDMELFELMVSGLFDEFYERPFSDTERKWVGDLLKANMPLLRVHLWDANEESRSFPDGLFECEPLLFFVELNRDDVARMWDIIQKPPLEYDDYLPLCVALLRMEGPDALPGILSALRTLAEQEQCHYWYRDMADHLRLLEPHAERLGLPEVKVFHDAFFQVYQKPGLC